MRNLHLQPDETGNIPSPFPYLNPDSKDWQGDDESDGEEGFDGSDGIVAPFQPMPEGNDGGDEVDPDDEDEDDNDDDTGFGFLVGIGLLLGNRSQPRFA